MKILRWIDSLVNRLATNMTLWIVGFVVVFGVIGYKGYSSVFVRLPEPPVYATYTVLSPARNPDAPQPPPCPKVETPQAAVYSNKQAPQATPSPTNSPTNAPPPAPCHPLDEWSDAQRERYYQTSQGSLVIPYAWFRALELRTGTEMFAAPNVQARYGLLPDSNPTYNKDQMPIGIVKNIVRDEDVATLGEGHKEWASISCAACHTGQLTYRGSTMRIDGNQGFWYFDQWSQDLVFSLMISSTIPQKFERFCSRVYGLPGSARCTDDAKKTLRGQISRYLNSDLVISAINAILQHTYPTKEGFTRTSALGRGVNGEFGPIDPCSGPLDRRCYRNVNMNTGPVSFPPLWYTHEYDWVQSTTAIRQPLGRNVTESWGVSVHVNLKPGGNQFASTHNIDDMFWMETLLSILQAPKWPEEIFSQVGPSGKINWERVKRGEYLFKEAKWANALSAQEAELPADKANKILDPNPTRPTTGYCARCHAPAFEPEDAYKDYGAKASTQVYGADTHKFLQLPLYRQNVMGTDPDDAVQFASRQVHTRELAPLFVKYKVPNPELVDIGTTLLECITRIEDRWFEISNISKDSECRKIMEGHRENLFRAPLGYPARPLDGYWATGPFLHNGSVRTIYELLSPVSERAKTFWIGSREFDPVTLGFENQAVEGAFLYDTSLKGNSNGGHEFREAPKGTDGVIGPYLSAEDRLAIIEYLKVMRSVPELLDADPATKDRLYKRNALLKVLSPYYEANYSTYNGAYWVEPGNQPDRPDRDPLNHAAFCREIEAAERRGYGTSSPSPAPAPTPTKK